MCSLCQITHELQGNISLPLIHVLREQAPLSFAHKSSHLHLCQTDHTDASNHAEAFTLYSELQTAGNDSSLKGSEQYKPIPLDPT
jgi:hypothetical protein